MDPKHPLKNTEKKFIFLNLPYMHECVKNLSQICMMKNKTACKCHKVSKIVQFGSDMLCKKCPKKVTDNVTKVPQKISEKCVTESGNSVTKLSQNIQRKCDKSPTEVSQKCYKMYHMRCRKVSQT